MTDRWDQIDRVWHAALAHPEEERAAAVVELCAGDDGLRRDVESLFAHLAQASAAGFGAVTGAGADRGPLIGRRIGPYALHALLGAGGMGEVYQAHDAALDREVAIKILPERWLDGPDRRARFDREARLLASLSHPNIGAIYGVHESDGVRALVLELIEGETLAECIARQPAPPRGLPLADVVTIAGQIVEAIEAAHERGVVHRDLKPANIKITPDTRVKVLDFGLARAVGVAGTDPAPAGSVGAATDGTLDGTLLGTPAYMSPEQARGRPVDGRADIWGFGCVLYEMLTGIQAFGGDSLAETLANVIKGEPNWSAVPPDVPPALRRSLRGCLQKDLRLRFHHIADVRLVMEGGLESPPADADAAATPARLSRRAAYAGWAVAAGMTVAAIALAVALGRGSTESADRPQTLTAPVLLQPMASGGRTGTAATIQDAIDQVGRGGTVTVLPGTYTEALIITKGLTLQATGERSGPVILAPGHSAESAIEIATTEPVVLHGLTVQVPGAHGIRGRGGVDLTVTQSTVLAVNPPEGRSALILVSNDAAATNARARVVVRDSLLDGTITRRPERVGRPQSHAVRLEGDIDAVLERNLVRRTGDICLLVQTRADLGGETNADIVDNDIDECHPLARVGAILVGAPSVLVLSPTQPITATGVVNIVGNAIRNSSEDCLASAIAFDVFGGRIERNRIIDFVQPCATRTTRNMPAAIWLGLRGPGTPPVPAVAPSVRYNDIQGNFRAGLRVASNQAIPVDASCNYWGSAQGPSGAGSGTGDAILVEPGAVAPVFVPFATTPIARRTAAGC